MSFKSKIIIRTFQFVLVLILVLLGIFAIYFVDNDNSIIPDVKNVNASLSATITGANETYNLEKLVYNGENLPSDQSLKTWENNNLTFKNTKEDIIISIVIENLSSENSLTVSVEDLSQEISNLSRIIKVENQENEYKSGDKIILEPSKGDVSVDKGERISVLKQDHFAYEEYSVMDTVIMGNKELYDIMKEKEAIYAKPDFSEEDGMKAAKLEERFAELDGWNAEADSAILLNDLGIIPEDHYKLMK